MRVVLFLHCIYLIVYSLFLLLLLRFLHHPPRVNHFSNGLVENASSFAGAPIKRRTQESRRLAVLHRWSHILWRWIKCKATFFLLNNNECSSGTLIFFASCHQTIIAVKTNLINSKTKSEYEIQVPFQFPLFLYTATWWKTQIARFLRLLWGLGVFGDEQKCIRKYFEV